MAKYFLRRLLTAIPILLVVTFLANAMLSLVPGDPSKTALGFGWTPELGKKYLAERGLDRPLVTRYLSWLWNALQGDFGPTKDGFPAIDVIRRALPLSLQLVIMSLVMALLLAIPMGIYSAYRAGTRQDRIVTTGAFGALSIPGFVLGVLVILVGKKLTFGGSTPFFAVDPVPFFSNPLQSIRALFLPSFAVAIGQAAGFIRILRTDMATTLQDDFVLMAKSKGMSDKFILFRHAFRPSSFTLLTVIGVSIGNLMGGLIIVERQFNLHGLGETIYGSIFLHDFTVTLAAVAVITIIFILVATVVDLAYGMIDPRVRQARKLG
jgi:peptide/nickel transport system permease protein